MVLQNFNMWSLRECASGQKEKEVRVIVLIRHLETAKERFVPGDLGE